MRLKNRKGRASNKPSLFLHSFRGCVILGYFRRDPDILYLNWIGELDANPADSRHMVEGFVDATEYRNRFKQ